MGRRSRTPFGASRDAGGWVVALADMPFIRPDTIRARRRAARGRRAARRAALRRRTRPSGRLRRPVRRRPRRADRRCRGARPAARRERRARARRLRRPRRRPGRRHAGRPRPAERQHPLAREGARIPLPMHRFLKLLATTAFAAASTAFAALPARGRRPAAAVARADARAGHAGGGQHRAWSRASQADEPAVARSVLPPLLQPARPARSAQAISAGSGVIVDAARGLVITNHHVDRRDAQEIVGVAEGPAASSRRSSSAPIRAPTSRVLRSRRRRT